jgi:hypothetical protein
MARTPVSTTERRKVIHRRSVVVVAALGGILAAARRHSLASKPAPRPMHTSILTGIGWVRELQSGHPVRFRRQMGMSKTLFQKLLRELHSLTGLRDSKHVRIEEQVAIFLKFCVTERQTVNFKSDSNAAEIQFQGDWNCIIHFASVIC